MRIRSVRTSVDSNPKNCARKDSDKLLTSHDERR
jgi:hypothetical protein